MQIILKSIILAMIMATANVFSDWWTFAILAFICPWFCNNLKDSILLACGASLLLWTPLLIYYYIDGGNILFNRVSQLIGLNYPLLLILFSSTLVVILGFLASYSGFYLKDYYDNKN